MGLLMLTALFIPFASPNVISTVYDITLPEVRSTALSIQYFIEDVGAALAPLMAGIIAADSPIIVTAYPGWPLAVNKRLGGAFASSLWYWDSLFKDRAEASSPW